MKKLENKSKQSKTKPKKGTMLIKLEQKKMITEKDILHRPLPENKIY